MYNWKNVTEFFTEDQRHYKNTYLEICEVYNDEIEVSLFSSEDEPYEIYFSFGELYGIIYVDEETSKSKREKVKNALAREYKNHKEPTDEFINEFCESFNVSMPNDILFDSSDMFGF